MSIHTHQYLQTAQPVLVPDPVPSLVTMDKWFAVPATPIQRKKRKQSASDASNFAAALAVAPAPPPEIFIQETLQPRRKKRQQSQFLAWDSRGISTFTDDMFSALQQQNVKPRRKHTAQFTGGYWFEPVYSQAVFSSGDVVEFVLRIDQLHETTLSISQLGSFVLRIDQAADFTLER